MHTLVTMPISPGDPDYYPPTHDLMWYELMRLEPEFGLHVIQSTFPESTWTLKDVKGFSLQHHLRHGIKGRSLILDYLMQQKDESNNPTDVNIEMQSYRYYFGPKRVRSHLSSLDMASAASGSSFKEHHGTAGIFICGFDPRPPHGLPRYDVFSAVKQLNNEPFEDDRRAVLFNLDSDRRELLENDALRNLFEFLLTGEGQDEITRRMARLVYDINNDPDERNAIQMVDLVLQREFAAGEARGLAKGEARLDRLVEILKASGRENDLLKVVTDSRYRQELYKKYGLN